MHIRFPGPLTALLLVAPAWAGAPAAATIQGRILGPDARPLVSASVALVPLDPQAPSLRAIERQATGPDGSFRLPAGTGRRALSVNAPGCLPEFRPLPATPGAPERLPDIRLRRGGCRIRGCLRTAPGVPLEHATLGFVKHGQGGADLWLAPLDGNVFDITLAPGTYLAIAEAAQQAGTSRFQLKHQLDHQVIQLVPDPAPAGPETRDWIRQTLLPLAGTDPGRGLEDLRALQPLVGEAQVVGLGEATHGTREFFQLKHRMLEYLVRELGFTLFVMEAGSAEARAVDAYVREGRGDPAQALAGLGFWTWDTREVLGLVKWIRGYNQGVEPARQVRFYGVDMQFDQRSGEQAQAWLDGRDRKAAAQLRAFRNRMRRAAQAEGTARASAFSALARELAALAARMESRRLPGSEAAWACHNLRLLAQYADLEADPAHRAERRDAAMARNLQWIRACEPGAKAALWAHNGHISMHPESAEGNRTLGWHLRCALGPAYRPIGLLFGQGGFQAFSADPARPGVLAFQVEPNSLGTLDRALAGTGAPVFALDLRTRPASGPVRTWLDSPQGTWNIGAVFAPGQDHLYLAVEPVTAAYDALLFVDRTTRAQPLRED